MNSAFNLINPCSTSEDVALTSLTHELFLNLAKEILLFSSNSKSSPARRELLLCWIWCSLEQHMKFLKRAKDFTWKGLFFCQVPGSPCYLCTRPKGRGEVLAKETRQYWLLFTTPGKVPASGQMGWGWACAFSKLCRTTPAVCHVQEAHCSQGSKFLSATSR